MCNARGSGNTPPTVTQLNTYLAQFTGLLKPETNDPNKKAGADQWEGQVYNAKDGQLYNSTITPSGTDRLEIRGCVLGFLCGGETWTRVGPPLATR